MVWSIRLWRFTPSFSGIGQGRPGTAEIGDPRLPRHPDSRPDQDPLPAVLAAAEDLHRPPAVHRAVLEVAGVPLAEVGPVPLVGAGAAALAVAEAAVFRVAPAGAALEAGAERERRDLSCLIG